MSTSRSTLMGLPVHAIVARNARSSTVNNGVNSLVSTGAMFSMTLCFASTSHEPMMNGSGRSARDQPALNEPLRVHFDGGEHHQRKAREDAPAQRDECVVDHQFAREPDEVHARTVGEPAAPDVGEADGQP